MNPARFSQMMKYLTRAKKADPDLPDVFPASKAPIPAKTQNVQETEAVNQFMLRNPRVEKAGGGRIGFFEAGMVEQGVNKGKASIPYFNDGKTAYFKDLPSAEKALAERKDKTSRFKKARTILNDPKLKKEFIKYGNQKGVSIKDIRKKFNISMEEFYDGGLRNLFDKDFQLQQAKKIKPKTINNINQLLNNKEAFNFLKKGQIVPDEIITKLKLAPSEAATATVRIGQIYGGNDFGIDKFKKIRKNVKASDKLFEAMNKFQFGNPYRAKLYRASLELIDQQLGNEKGTFESLKKKASYILKKNKIKGFDINEIAGVTGTARTGVGEFSQFVDIMDSNLNQKQMASFQSAFSQARQNIMNDPNVFAKESKRINRLAGIFEKEYGVELPRIRALNEVEKFYSPTRLKQLSDQGLDIKAASKKLGYTVQMPKSAVTIQEFVGNKKVQANILEIVRKNKAQAITDAAIKTASVGGFNEKLKVLCGGKAFGGRVGLAKGTDPFCPAARQDPEGFLKKLTADGDIGKFFRSAKAVNIAKNVARLSFDAANPFTLLGGEIFYVGLDSANSVSKGMDFDEALDKAFIFYDFDTFDSKILERAKNQGFDENQINLLQSTINLNKLDNKQLAIEKQFDVAKDDYSEMSSDVSMGAEMALPEVNKQIADESQKYINILDKMGFDLSKTESYNTGLNYLNNLFKKKTQSELLKSYENRKRKLDPEGGVIGDVLKPIFDTQSYTQPFKFALDIVNPFTRNVGFESDRAKEQRYLNEMDPRELYLYNKERGFTLDDIQAGTSPFVNKAMEDRSLGEAALGKGLFQNYAGGGIAKIAGIDQGPPPVKGPNSQGLQGLLKRGIKI